MRAILSSFELELDRYRTKAEDAFAQLEDRELNLLSAPGGNSIAVLVWHLTGNFESRFTEFLTTDGEKPWRRREEEFRVRTVTRDELLEKWARGWDIVDTTLAGLTDADLSREVRIRGQPLTVADALARALAHVAYHVGQIVLVARNIRRDAWRFLSIPPGGSEAYNRNPTLERGRSADPGDEEVPEVPEVPEGAEDER
jgi:uncharacterized damage-inducible protein DinB